MVDTPADQPKQTPTPTDDKPVLADFKGEIKEVDFEGYKFKVDTDLIDDVDALDMIDAIENKQQPKVIVDFLVYLIGQKGYDEMKAHFVEKDGRFRLSKLANIYQAIFENFDPKE